jgi:hypothetical protein
LSKPLPLKTKKMAGTIAKLIAEPEEKTFAIINGNQNMKHSATLTYLVMQKHTFLMVEELGMQD